MTAAKHWAALNKAEGHRRGVPTTFSAPSGRGVAKYRRLVDMMRGQDPMTMAELVVFSGQSKSALDHAVNYARQRGLILKHECGLEAPTYEATT